MVCARCIKVVSNVFDEIELPVRSVQLGVVETNEAVPEEKLAVLKARLAEEGFEVLDDQKIKMVEQIKNAIVDLVHYKNLDDLNINLSTYLSGLLHRDYNYLSNLFSSIENTTIEQFFILQKIEKVKELLVYNELTLSEIAFRLGYSSVAHLSNQFKKITGFTPSEFKKLKDHNRKSLDEV